MSSLSARKAGNAIGSMVFSCFGTAWLIWWCLEVFGTKPEPMMLFLLFGGVMLALSVRQFSQNKSAYKAEAETPERKRSGRIFNIVNGLQWLLIFGTAFSLNYLGLSAWILPAVIFIVGAHFIPLAALFKAPRHYFTGVAIVLFAFVYPFVADGGPKSPIGLLGIGLILWGSALSSLIPNLREDR
ncbi:hypothetical protein ACO0LF_29910 [Undibacterium sp. Di27W]|uniref:hypothetical protein n=1 Tax=Undibacterium sp. Di27W TaxID=3413036 RepID=UPI003BF25CC4